MATVSYPPFYTQKITDGEGQPVAGGKILSFYAGTDVPLAVYTEDGTSLGAEVDIDGDGYARFCLKTGLSYKLVCKYADGSIVWTRDNVRVNVSGDGMANPMEAEGDIIVGGPDGQPDRLAHGTTGQVLKIGADGNPGWATDAEGMQNPMSSFGQMISGGLAGAPNVLAAPTGDQFLGVTSTVYGPFPQWWPLINAIVKGLATTPAGTASGFTKGDLLLGGDAITGGALHNYTGVDRLPIGTSGKILTSNGTTATWADPVTQEGDHKAKTSATDSDPNFLENKVLGGDLIQVEKEQTPDGDGGYFENLRVHLDARGVTAGYVPTADGSNGAAWAPPAGGMTNPMTTAGDIIVGGASGTPDRLGAGTDGNVLTMVSGTPAWAAPGGGGGGSDLGYAPYGQPLSHEYFGFNNSYGTRLVGTCLPQTIKSFTIYSRDSFNTMFGSNGWFFVALYDAATNALVTPFTWDNHSGFPGKDTIKPITLSYDSPATIDRTKDYLLKISFRYSSAKPGARLYGATVYFDTNFSSQGLVGTNTRSGTIDGNAPSSATAYSWGSAIQSIPWFSLNTFAGEA